MFRLLRAYLYSVYYNGRLFLDVRALCRDEAVGVVVDILRARGISARVEFVECVGD